MSLWLSTCQPPNLSGCHMSFVVVRSTCSEEKWKITFIRHIAAYLIALVRPLYHHTKNILINPSMLVQLLSNSSLIDLLSILLCSPRFVHFISSLLSPLLLSSRLLISPHLFFSLRDGVSVRVCSPWSSWKTPHTTSTSSLTMTKKYAV